jgi:hypothetical protein
MWIVTRTMTAADTPETFEFAEPSSFGVRNGVVTIVKTR